ncbi:MAG: SMI1/KNR4 family protein [Acidimicrobiales bacterium]
MSDAVNWRERIVELGVVKQTIDELDTTGLWEYRLPGVAATAAQLEAVEDALGEPFDPSYRTFLEHAGGWPAFWQTVDLFGPDDLLGGERFKHACEMLSYVEDNVLDDGGLRRSGLLPIAASPVDLDLFVMTRRSSPSPGGVVWLAGAEVDRWSSFDEFFLAMVDYNRLELQQLQGSAGGSR